MTQYTGERPSDTIRFASDRARKGWDMMLPPTQRLANEMARWLWIEFGIYLTLTETHTSKEQDNALQRVSTTHRDGRAFDVRIRDPLSGDILLSEDVIAKFCAHFRKKYPNLGAISKGTPGQRSLIVYKPHGSGPHLHIQIKQGAKRWHA